MAADGNAQPARCNAQASAEGNRRGTTLYYDASPDSPMKKRRASAI
jgi:hypothetical protein